MDDKLHLNLIKLEEELSKLKNAVNYIEAAEKITKLATGLINEFDSLKRPFTDFAKSSEKLLKEMDKVDFQKRFNDTNSILNSVLEEVELINQNGITVIKNLENFQNNLDLKLSSLRKSLENIQLHLDLSEKNLREVINQNNLKLISVFENEIIKLKKENKKNTIMIVVGLILILSGIFVLIIR